MRGIWHGIISGPRDLWDLEGTWGYMAWYNLGTLGPLGPREYMGVSILGTSGPLGPRGYIRVYVMVSSRDLGTFGTWVHVLFE